MIGSREYILEGAAYKKLTDYVFFRDGWICRCCRQCRPLHAHHLIKRSDLRIDAIFNPGTLGGQRGFDFEPHD